MLAPLFHPQVRGNCVMNSRQGVQREGVLRTGERLAVVLSLIHPLAVHCDELQFLNAWLCGFMDFII